jgi:hypothetical protein
MPEFESTNEFHDELLSAYLDGELSAEERAGVEERLAVDPVARQMLDELRSVSLAVQGLPREKPGADLQSEILRRAEESLRSSTQPGERPSALRTVSTNGDDLPAAEQLTPHGGGVPPVSVGRTRRGWVWAGLAVAAALLIMVLNGDDAGHDALPQVANRELRRGQSVGGEGDRAVPELRAVGDQPAAAGSAEVAQEFDRLSTREQSLAGRDAAALLPAAAVPEGLTVPPERFARGAQGTTDFRVAGTDQLGDEAKGALEATEKQSQSEAVVAQTPTVQQELRQTLPADGKSIDDSIGVVGEIAAGGDARALGEEQAARDLGAGGVPMNRGAVTAAPNSAPLSEQLAKEMSPPRGDLLIVHVSVRQAALVGREFDQKLARNQIALESAHVAAAAERSSGVAADRAGGRVAESMDADYQYLARLYQADRPAPGETDAIYVEAPHAAVEQLLADLDADAENVLSISVDQLSGSEQLAPGSQLASLDWKKYRRVAVAEVLQEEGRERESEVSRFGVVADANDRSSAMGGGGRGGGDAGRGGRGAVAAGRGGRRGRADRGGRAAAAASEQSADVGASQSGAQAAEMVEFKVTGGRASQSDESSSPSAKSMQPVRNGQAALAGSAVASEALGRQESSTLVRDLSGRARRVAPSADRVSGGTQWYFDDSQSLRQNLSTAAPVAGGRGPSQPASGSPAGTVLGGEEPKIAAFGSEPAAANAPAGTRQPIGGTADSVSLDALQRPAPATPPAVNASPLRVLFVLRAEPAAGSATTSPPPSNPPK